MGIGNITFTQIFHSLIIAVGVHKTLMVIGASLAILSLIPCVFVRWPEQRPTSNAQSIQTTKTLETCSADSSLEIIPLLSPTRSAIFVDDDLRTSVRISWKDIIRTAEFWYYMIVVFTAGASYAFNPFYYKLGLLFARPMNQLVRFYQVTDFTATILSLAASSWTDAFHTRSGYWFSGARNLTIIFLVVQTVLFMWMTRLTKDGAFWGFLIVKSVLKIIMVSHGGCASLLARDFFGPSNSCIVFGFGAGLALGTGEGFSAWLMSAVETSAHKRHGSVLVAENYNPFFYAAAVWSTIGLACTIMMRKSRLAFPPGPHISIEKSNLA